VRKAPLGRRPVPRGFWDDGGDGNAKLELSGAWRITNLQNHTISGAYGYASAEMGASIRRAPVFRHDATIATAGRRPVLSYWARYNWSTVGRRSGGDFTNGGGSWSPISPSAAIHPAFSSPGIPPQRLRLCASQGPSPALRERSAHRLDAIQPRSFGLQRSNDSHRWRFSSDGGTEYAGFYLDDIAVPWRASTTPVPAQSKEASRRLVHESGQGRRPRADRLYAGLRRHRPCVYWDRGPISGDLKWMDSACDLLPGSSFDPGIFEPGQWCYFVVVGQNGSIEGSYGRHSSGIERPEATGIGKCDLPMNLMGPVRRSVASGRFKNIPSRSIRRY